MYWPMECRSVEKIDGGGEQALVVLALALAEELLPPLVHHGEAGLVAGHELRCSCPCGTGCCGRRRTCSSRFSWNVASSYSVSWPRRRRAISASMSHAGHGDGQQAHGGEHGVAAAHVVGHHEGLVALVVGQVLQGALGLVGGGSRCAPGRPPCRTSSPAASRKTRKATRGLGGGAGFGNHVDGEVLVLAPDPAPSSARSVGADGVADEVDVGRVLLVQVVYWELLQAR